MARRKKRSTAPSKKRRRTRHVDSKIDRHAVSGTTVTSNSRSKLDFFGRKKSSILPYDLYKNKHTTRGLSSSKIPMWTLQRANLELSGQKKFDVNRFKQHQKLAHKSFSTPVPIPWLDISPRISTKSLQHLTVREVEDPTPGFNTEQDEY